MKLLGWILLAVALFIVMSLGLGFLAGVGLAPVIDFPVAGMPFRSWLLLIGQVWLLFEYWR